MRIETRRDPVLSAVHYNVLNEWKEPHRNLIDEMRPFQLKKEELTTEDDCILWGSGVIIPKSLRKKVLEQFHGVHV